MAQLDYCKLGFTMTVADVAEFLEIEPFEVRHLLLTNDLTGVMVSAGQFAAISLLLHPDEVVAYAKLRAARAQTVDSRNRSRSLKMLHQYLAENAPVDDYDRAVVENVPLLACSGTELAVHVRLGAVIAYHARSGRQDVPPTESMLTEALTRVGAVRRKGVIAGADRGSGAKQRWGVWWRVPSAVLADANENDVARHVVDGPMGPGEQVRIGTGGAPFLGEALPR